MSPDVTPAAEQATATGTSSYALRDSDLRIAIKRDDTLVDDRGHVVGHDAGATLVRRLLRLFPDPVVIGPGARRCDGFDIAPVEFLDPARTVVINMDVLDSPYLWDVLATGDVRPRIMNFAWWNTSVLPDDVRVASLALSCALFPTFANSQRTATEIREVVDRWTVKRLADQARLASVNLGFRVEHVQPRERTDTPVVLYPAIYLSKRKRPELFLEVLERVHRDTPLTVEMRLHESHLISERAMNLSRRDWIWVGPLTASRSSYWHALARTTAFLATADDESYGLSYVEALGAGVIGILPDRSWARALLPPDYPFLYEDAAGAERLLRAALADPDAARRTLDDSVGGGDGAFVAWIRARHDDDAFEREFTAHVQEWFGH